MLCSCLPVSVGLFMTHFRGSAVYVIVFNLSVHVLGVALNIDENLNWKK